jgi:two-component system, NarL family, response regulator DegU
LANLEHASNENPSLQTIRIAIADQQPIFRHGLRRLLETDPRLVIVSETNDGATAAEAIRELRPDILLLGLNASRYPAVDTLREVAANGGEVRTIILAVRLGAPEVASAIQLGACAVLPKDSAPDELFNCIHAVMAGHMWVGRAPTSTMDASLKKLKATRRQLKAFGLTQREIEIVKAVMADSSTKGIAERSSISQNTVKSHLAHIFSKMGVSNRVELVQFAAHHRLLDLI